MEIIMFQTLAIFAFLMALILVIRLISGRINVRANAAIPFGIIALLAAIYLGTGGGYMSFIYAGAATLGLALIALLIGLLMLIAGAQAQNRNYALRSSLILGLVGIGIFIAAGVSLFDIQIDPVDAFLSLGIKSFGYLDIVWWGSAIWTGVLWSIALVRTLVRNPTAIRFWRLGAWGAVAWLLAQFGPQLYAMVF